ncbi:VOC family protein [Vibrio penaeicida]|uniref:VOC family protein n=1 Tax=Vibrio penaeicida TaxID=104609 RepID=UPI000CEA0B99|nr:VOC family protein [Vibrio penaeicida]
MIKVHGINHIGFTVPDIEQAVQFFTDVFGAETIMNVGYVDVDDEFMKKRLGVNAGRRIKDMRVLQCGIGGALEIFEYSGEDATPQKMNSEIGGFHIALEVDNVYESAERLKTMGVDLLEGPTLIDAGPMEGLNWLYFRTPWGLYMEIVSTEGAMGYEKEGGPKMWSPKPSV